MYVVAVTVYVKAEFVNRFIEASLVNARNTRKEPGNARFDVSRSEEDPNRFLFYEAYHLKDDFVKHQQTPHYFAWKDAVTASITRVPAMAWYGSALRIRKFFH